MLKDLVPVPSVRVKSSSAKDSIIAKNAKDSNAAKNIVDLLFIFINGMIRDDKKTNAFTRALILKALPGIRGGTKEYIDNNVSSLEIKKLLDGIQFELDKR